MSMEVDQTNDNHESKYKVNYEDINEFAGEQSVSGKYFIFVIFLIEEED